LDRILHALIRFTFPTQFINHVLPLSRLLHEQDQDHYIQANRKPFRGSVAALQGSQVYRTSGKPTRVRHDGGDDQELGDVDSSARDPETVEGFVL